MATKQWILFMLSAAMSTGLVGCSSSTFDVKNPPPPPPPKLSVAFQPPPAGSILINTTTDVTAVVSDDPGNSGVDWSVTCSNTSNCGHLSALHTASGQPTTYTPPPTLSGNSEGVDIVAFATADHTKNVVAPITVTAFGSSLLGNYVLQAQGVDSTLGPYQFAGVIKFDGNGGIVNGEQTVNFFDQTAGTLLSKSDPVTGGSYFLGPDGRGTITIDTNDNDIGGNGVETFAFVYLSSSHALISEIDFGAAATGFSATGTMDLQTSVGPASGGYAFVVNGFDINNQVPAAFGGIFNIDSPNTISGKGSVADQNLGGTVTAKQTLSGTITDPDSFGAVTLNLTASVSPTTPIQFTGYIVDATHIQLIESDNDSGAGTGSTGGVAIGQGSATGTFTDDTSFSGTYVSGVLGVDLTGTTPNSLTSLSVLTADGSGGVANGFTDTVLQQSGAQGGAGVQITAQFTGSYSVDKKGTGRVQSTFNHFLPHQKPTYQPKFFFYLTGNGNPPLVLDGGDLNYPSLGAGVAYPQSAAPLTFGGKYGFDITQQNGSETDGTGQMTADPTANTLAGIVDLNSAFSGSFDNPFNDTFQPPDSNGRFSGSLFNSAITVEYYIIDPTHGFFVETDLSNTAQVSFGQYVTRTPVCQSCP